MKVAIITALLIAAMPISAQAQAIERACLRSDRDVKNSALCGCIQDAANLTLTKRDQKLASTFYKDPHKAQEVRQSPRPDHAKFWDRYKVYAETAEEFCG